jgi:hypothetical protein
MFSAFFRSMRQQEVVENAPTINNTDTNPPTAREILDYGNRCMDTYKQIIDMNKQIAADIRQTTRLLTNTMPRPQQIRTCPNNHELVLYTAIGGNCDVCNRIVFVGEQVMDCRSCNWYMCARCSRNNGFSMPQPSMANLINQLFPQPASEPVPAPSTELFTFDIPLNGQGFDDFINQLTQTLNQISPIAQEDVVIAPTETQINRACVVMPASEANIGEQFVCPIDLSPIEVDDTVMKIKHCGHVFRENNLRELFTRDVKCPMCRFDIREHDEVTANYDEGGDNLD